MAEHRENLTADIICQSGPHGDHLKAIAARGGLDQVNNILREFFDL